jgi:hypothetical protein
VCVDNPKWLSRDDLGAVSPIFDGVLEISTAFDSMNFVDNYQP